MYENEAHRGYQQQQEEMAPFQRGPHDDCHISDSMLCAPNYAHDNTWLGLPGAIDVVRGRMVWKHLCKIKRAHRKVYTHCAGNDFKANKGGVVRDTLPWELEDALLFILTTKRAQTKELVFVMWGDYHTRNQSFNPGLIRKPVPADQRYDGMCLELCNTTMKVCDLVLWIRGPELSALRLRDHWHLHEEARVPFRTILLNIGADFNFEAPDTLCRACPKEWIRYKRKPSPAPLLPPPILGPPSHLGPQPMTPPTYQVKGAPILDGAPTSPVGALRLPSSPNF